MNIRAATHADVEFLIAVQNLPHARGFVRVPTSEAVIDALTRTDRATFIISDDDTAVGMLLLAYDPASPGIVEFRRIVVAAPGRGIGTFAVNWVITWAFERMHAHRLWLDVVESNIRARSLYEKIGFVHEGTFRDGFRCEDGSYANLCVYGLLETDRYLLAARS